MTLSLHATIERQIATAEERLRLAMLASDPDALERLIAPELIFTNHLGQVFGKAEDLQLHRSGQLTFQSIEWAERQWIIGPLITVVSARFKLAGVYQGSPFDADLRYTRVWKLTVPARWQIVAGHSSAVLA